MIASLLSKLLAALLAALLIAAVCVFPANKFLLGAGLAVIAGVLLYRPALWLLLVPALLPVLDFTPWTGWFFLEDLDLLLLVCAAVGYWRLGTQPPAVVLPGWMRAALVLLTICVAASTWIGLQPWQPLDANAFANYTSHYNSLRIAKGYAWALLLLPLMRRTAGRDPEWLQHYFIPGMLLGLAGTCLAVLLERATFPGLLNFASDYRPTAPFSAMHTGGAALDAYLAISFPFALFWLYGVQSHLRLGLALLLLLLGCYAGFALFSRDIYLAYGVSLATVALLTFVQHLQHDKIAWIPLLGRALLLAVLSFALFRVFITSGYRGLLAGMILVAAAMILGASERRPSGLAGIAAGAVALCALDLALAAWLRDAPLGGISKGPYLAFTVSAAVFGTGTLLLCGTAPALRQRGMAIAVAGAPGLALCMALVSIHWGGPAAAFDSLVLIGLAAALVVLNRRLATPLIKLNRQTLTAALFSGIVLATLIPITNSYYFGTRFSTVNDDVGVRMRHWREALQMMPPDALTSALGMGLGTYPAAYFWKNTHGELPPTFSYGDEDSGRNRFLHLANAQYPIGYGEPLRMLQPVSVRRDGHYRISFDVRRSSAAVQFGAAVCERWLLYTQNCLYPKLQLRAPDGLWQHYEYPLDQGKTSGQAWPVQLQLLVDGPGGYADVDNVSLSDAVTGEELVHNGSFSSANDYWFFSSDRNHFPWHIKNFYVNSYFELGGLGAATLGLVLLGSLGGLAVRGIQGDSTAAIHLAALLGFLMIGLFDSLFDVPRLILVFFLVLYAASLRPPRPVRRKRRSSRV